MTREEFDKMQFRKGMRFKVKGTGMVMHLVFVDFKGIIGGVDNLQYGHIHFYPCCQCEIVEGEP